MGNKYGLLILGNKYKESLLTIKQICAQSIAFYGINS